MLLPPTLAIMDSFRTLNGVKKDGKKRKVKESEVVSIRHKELAFAWAVEKKFMGGDHLAINVMFVKFGSKSSEILNEGWFRDVIKNRGDTSLTFKQAAYAVDVEPDDE